MKSTAEFDYLHHLFGNRREEVLTHATIRMCPVKSVFLGHLTCFFSILPAHLPLHLTVQILSTEPPMTHVEVSATGEVMQRKRNLNRHSCASASPPVPSCHGDGCGDCHCGNGGVHGADGDRVGCWGVLEWRSTGLAIPDNDAMASHIIVEVTREIDLVILVLREGCKQRCPRLRLSTLAPDPHCQDGPRRATGCVWSAAGNEPPNLESPVGKRNTSHKELIPSPTHLWILFYFIGPSTLRSPRER